MTMKNHEWHGAGECGSGSGENSLYCGDARIVTVIAGMVWGTEKRFWREHYAVEKRIIQGNDQREYQD
jgi:hypothetical protein